MYRSVKDCAVDIILKEGNGLTNRQIAEKVRSIMNSRTSEACIAWYKNKIKHGDIVTAPEIHQILTEPHWPTYKYKVTASVIENKAEQFVSDYEKERTGSTPVKITNSLEDTYGYDFDSGDRHIEVKWKRRKQSAWLQLTANETEALIKDPKYFLYLVEGDFENNEKVDLYVIPKEDLLSMVQLKIHARLTQLSNIEKRKIWKVDELQ